MTIFATRDVYVVVIAQVEAHYVGSFLHLNPFYFCNLYCIFIVHNHMHWILESNVGFFVWQGLLIALLKSWKEDFLFMG